MENSVADSLREREQDAGEQPFRTVEHSQDYLAEVIGEESKAGQRIQAGPVFKLMYDAAVVVALRHCGQRPVLLRLDRMDLIREIVHMDLVRLEGRMVEVGRSSMVIEVRGYNCRQIEREFDSCFVSYVTMVVIDEDGQSIRRVPPLSYDTPQGRESKALAAHRRAQLEERKSALAWIDQANRLRVGDVADPAGPIRYEYIPSAQTEVRVKRRVISQIPHLDGRVRAGDLLEWLDRIANYTARRFTRNPHTVTLSINDLVFTKPLRATDRIELTSRVVYVRTHTLEVVIDIVVHTLEGEEVPLHPVEFFILNYSPSGVKQKITTGLALSEEDQDGLRHYLKAHTRYSFWKAHPESHLTQVPG